MHNSVFGCTELVFDAKYMYIEKTVVELLFAHSCTGSVFWAWLDYHATPEILKQNPQKSTSEHARRLWRQF